MTLPQDSSLLYEWRLLAEFLYNPDIPLERIRILTTTLNNNIHHPATAVCRQSMLSRSPDFVESLAAEAIILFFLNHDT